jgi:hypothetical protein
MEKCIATGSPFDPHCEQALIDELSAPEVLEYEAELVARIENKLEEQVRWINNSPHEQFASFLVLSDVHWQAGS